MKKTTLFIFSLCSAAILFGQGTPDTRLVTLARFDLGHLGIGFTYEPRITDKMVIELSGGAGGGYNLSGGTFYHVWKFVQPAFYFSATPKFYYNRQKRFDKGKSLLNNSGNYLGLRVRYTTPGVGPDDDLRDTGLINLHWGIQRPIGEKWTFTTHVGLGYAQDLVSRNGMFYPAFDLRFSYIFLQRKVKQAGGTP